MELVGVTRKYNDAVDAIGKDALATLFPKDFEVYMVAFELTDFQDRTIDYFVLPIMPDSITKTEPSRTNIKKTSSGVAVLSSTSFAPQEVTIKGNFGRKFKFNLNLKEAAIQGVAFSIGAGKYDLQQMSTNALSVGVNPFDIGIQTGFRAHSILRGIINKSNGVDKAGNPFKLYFYNLALNESYLVKANPNGLTSSQTKDKNMIWEYSLPMTIIAPLSALRNNFSKGSLTELLTFNQVQVGVNVVSNAVTSALI